MWGTENAQMVVRIPLVQQCVVWNNTSDKRPRGENMANAWNNSSLIDCQDFEVVHLQDELLCGQYGVTLNLIF